LSDEYVVRWFREDDLPAYIEGLNKALYDEYDEEVFDWKHRRAPFSLGFTSVAVVEHVPTGAPVAFNPFMPLEVRAGREVFMALRRYTIYKSTMVKIYYSPSYHIFSFKIGWQ